MSKVIKVLGNEDDLDFNEICSFMTEGYIGLWDYENCCFFLVAKEDIEFRPVYLSTLIDSLNELDDAVYNKCTEHIEEVYERCHYQIKLLDE